MPLSRPGLTVILKNEEEKPELENINNREQRILIMQFYLYDSSVISFLKVIHYCYNTDIELKDEI